MNRQRFFDHGPSGAPSPVLFALRALARTERFPLSPPKKHLYHIPQNRSGQTTFTTTTKPRLSPFTHKQIFFFEYRQIRAFCIIIDTAKKKAASAEAAIHHNDGCRVENNSSAIGWPAVFSHRERVLEAVHPFPWWTGRAIEEPAPTIFPYRPIRWRTPWRQAETRPRYWPV